MSLRRKIVRLVNAIRKTEIYKFCKYRKINVLHEFKNLESENRLLVSENLNLRFKVKKMNNEKINVVFVCHRPTVWEALKTVFESMKSDDCFDVKIVAIPNKKELPKLGLKHEVYESEGAEAFWRKYDCIDGYDYDTGEWFDLKSLNPDYVFFQQPYNIMRCPSYKSWAVSKYAKICYVNYFSSISYGEVYDECLPLDFFKDISFYFTQNRLDDKFINNKCKEIENCFVNVRMTGYPRYDNIDKVIKYSDIWMDKEHKRFRIIWTPRWTTNEGNCHFFDFKDKILDFCEKMNVEFVFRPHPQAFLEWQSTGEFTIDDLKKYKKRYESNDYFHIDESNEYLGMFYSSDCLISDPSSVVNDYFLTKNPIIYCKGKEKYDDAVLLKGGLYNVYNWNDLERVLLDIIRGNDPLLKNREKIINNNFYINSNGAGYEIKENIKKDFYSN